MRRKLKINSLKSKIILSIGIVIALCAVVSAFIVSQVVEHQMTDKYEVDKEAATEFLSYSLAPMLDLYDYKQVERAITSSLIYESIASIAVFDDRGTLIKSAIEQNVTSEELDVEKHNITSNGKVIGSFEIGFSKEYIDEQIQTTTGALIFGVLGFLILVGFALFAFMNRSVIEPLQAFTKTVKEINPDNLSRRMQVRSEDELGTLATSFNQMADDLERSHRALQKAHDELERKVEERTRGERRRAEQLRAINEVGRRISSILSLDELLPFVVKSLQETFNYYNVNIFLLDPGSDDLVLKAGAGGYEGTVPVGLPVKVTEGIVGWVARSGKPLLANDVSQEPRYRFAEELADTRSELAVPIKMGTQILGVLDIESTELNAFDETDPFVAETLADQVAIAIQNAKLYEQARELATVEERQRLARDLHDAVTQTLFSASLIAEAVPRLWKRDPAEVQRRLEELRQLTRGALAEMRTLLLELRPAALEEAMLGDLLRQLTEAITGRARVPIVLTVEEERMLPPDVQVALYRIAQEALNNVAKHAGASQATVNLRCQPEQVELFIRDDGRGFNPESAFLKHLGLGIMRERAEAIGATLKIESQVGHGTQVLVTWTDTS